jgi:DNA ligase-1
MRLRELVETSAKVRETASKNEKKGLIARLLKQVKGEETGIAADYLSGILPSGRLNIGWRTISEAAPDAGEPGESPSLKEVQARLDDIGRISGPGSAARRTRALHDLLAKMSEPERRFIGSLLVGEVRHGALEGLVLEAVAQASGLPLESIREAQMFAGSVGEVAQAALTEGAAGLERFGPQVFQPVSPMLATPVEGEEDALERLGRAAWEYKVDGARIQVHKSGDEVRIFTRRLNEVTERLPEIVALARKLKLREGVLDGEVFGVGSDGRPVPFQVTMRRFGRILDVERLRQEIPLAPYLFDLLEVEGQPMFGRPYRERVKELAERVPARYVIPRLVTGDVSRAREFLERSLSAGHEGIMAKALDSPYEAGKRGFQWLKIKPAQTLDLVVLAAEWGHGRRRGWLSNIHLGARDPQSGKFVMLGKTFKGLTDEMLRWLTDRLQKLEESRDDYTVYVRPELVVEVAYNDIQESPRYPGGLALRFARVRRFREDKAAREADTVQTVWALFKAQRKGGETRGDGK